MKKSALRYGMIAAAAMMAGLVPAATLVARTTRTANNSPSPWSYQPSGAAHHDNWRETAAKPADKAPRGFMKVDGIDSTQAKAFERQIDVVSWSWTPTQHPGTPPSGGVGASESVSVGAAQSEAGIKKIDSITVKQKAHERRGAVRQRTLTMTPRSGRTAASQCDFSAGVLTCTSGIATCTIVNTDEGPSSSCESPTTSQP